MRYIIGSDPVLPCPVVKAVTTASFWKLCAQGALKCRAAIRNNLVAR